MAAKQAMDFAISFFSRFFFIEKIVVCRPPPCFDCVFFCICCIWSMLYMLMQLLLECKLMQNGNLARNFYNFFKTPPPTAYVMPYENGRARSLESLPDTLDVVIELMAPSSEDWRRFRQRRRYRSSRRNAVFPVNINNRTMFFISFYYKRTINFTFWSIFISIQPKPSVSVYCSLFFFP